MSATDEVLSLIGKRIRLRSEADSNRAWLMCQAARQYPTMFSELARQEAQLQELDREIVFLRKKLEEPMR